MCIYTKIITNTLGSCLRCQSNPNTNIALISNLYISNCALSGPNAFIDDSRSVKLGHNCHRSSLTTNNGLGQTIYICNFHEEVIHEEESIYQCSPGSGYRATIYYYTGPKLTTQNINITKSHLQSWPTLDSHTVNNDLIQMNTIVGCKSGIIQHCPYGKHKITTQNYINNSYSSGYNYGIYYLSTSAYVNVADCIFINNNFDSVFSIFNDGSRADVSLLKFYKNTFNVMTAGTVLNNMPNTFYFGSLETCLDYRTKYFKVKSSRLF